MPNRPVRIRQGERKHRLAFWLSVGLAIAVVVIGWMFTIQDVLQQDYVQIREDVTEAVDRAAQEYVDVTTPGGELDAVHDIGEVTEQIKENYEIFEQVLEEERAQIDSLEEQTDSYAEEE